jgi:SRSO17 transposase
VPGGGHVDLATGRGHALIGRTLYLPEGCTADEEHRELAGVPDEVMFASKPQLAGDLLDRAHRLGIQAAFVAGDEVYGGRQLCPVIRRAGRPPRRILEPNGQRTPR